MKDILLGCDMLLIFVMGYIVVNKIDIFLKNIQSSSPKQIKRDKNEVNLYEKLEKRKTEKGVRFNIHMTGKEKGRTESVKR